ncbi:uncharacterized protein LOC128990063 [Macrosteles quadrilineatus]|uniref:uncharacterized protein LOC128990063 n=1 Tax=Macrosteles quadrilineatus TaxID=74068 RepID=UPI0023E298FC|nr:uncharacterized protein LOC128990063 [Macrosteles quadrilineatus]
MGSTVVASLLLASLALVACQQREHKVHNIVLYPHKHSWCKTTPIKQVVAYPGCDSLEVENNVCVGGCFSYSIPRTIPSSPGEVVPYCDSCQPSTHSWRQVALNCSSGEYEGEMLTKMVQIIENCTCAKCSGQREDEPVIGADDETEGDELPEKPQLMDIMDTTPLKYNYTVLSNQTNDNDTFINHRTMVLLGEISEREGEEVAHDQVALKEILHHVEGDDHKINGVILKDFVRKVEEKGHMNINLERLQRVLEKLEHAEHKYKNGHRHQHQHMMAGPHHSLVLPRDSPPAPEMYLKPTLDVPSHMLKPARDGAELSYHNNEIPDHHDDEISSDTE